MPADSANDRVWRVALPVPVPRLFDYRPVEGTANPDDVGCRVRVPFGSRELVGVVAAVGAPEPTAPEPRTGERLDVRPLIHGELLESLRWLARYTHAPQGEVFATALPGPLRQGEPLADTRAWSWRLTEAGRTSLPRLRGKPRQLAELLAGSDLDEDALADLLDDWRSPARALARRELVERFAVERNSVAALRPRDAGAAGAETHHARAPLPGPSLNPEQEAAAEALLGARAGFAPFLLDASLAAARPRSTCMRLPTVSPAAGRRWCWSPKSA